ncbi:unnamed protein product [Tilletia laevis]|uniref:Amino acid transporter transmembrane domain-containing protein n=2 Tax=Tilletia TaxID=13289 RepID=A0A177V190_9BASI|nr:hypothetical protein CF336_g1370 [Tilletia laevis]KAE8264343.1 hypothetical protein A4X03_0g1013 [Tilletia caries]KAE8207863.1 hypothetical protein CF335_g837 [Tilletia laevis]CAD6889866.1 unnamed protein product [Tilletia caries]CAD6944278.1 unnamed protein product [Tilletia laevis]
MSNPLPQAIAPLPHKPIAEATMEEKKAFADSASGSSDDPKIDIDDPEKGARIKTVPAEGSIMESGEIVYRTMSWQKCCALLLCEYVCLAILAFPSAFATLGMAGGLLATFFFGLVTLYTSVTLWKYCLRHPDALHIADIGAHIFGRGNATRARIAYELTAAALCINNIMIMGLHTLTGSKIINTLAAHPTCSVGLSIAVAGICIIMTLPRKLDHVAWMGVASAASMFISILLVLIFSGIQGKHPANATEENYTITITAFAPKGTTFVQGFNAMLNIIFTWVGQCLYPSMIAELRDPREFGKALYVVTAVEFVLFSVVGITVYALTGQFAGAPAVITLKPVFKKIAFAFVFPTTVIIGVLYASVVAKYVFARLFIGSRHYNNHTVLGWVAWSSIVAVTWVIGWIIGEGVPFFGDLLSLMSALFDGWFGALFWAVAYAEVNHGQLWVGQGLNRKAQTVLNVVIFFSGLFIFGPGLYTSVQAIINSYSLGYVKSPFTCANNGL